MMTAPAPSNFPVNSSYSSIHSQSSTNGAVASVPILISGSGPVGLFEAYLLTKLGIPVRIIERAMAISPLSKALGLQARILEIFEFTDLVDKALERGRPDTHLQFYYGTKHLVTLPALGNIDCYYRYCLFMEQSKVSEILVEELEKMGVKVDRGWELIDTKVVEEEVEEEKVEWKGDEEIAEMDGGKKKIRKRTKKSFVETTIRRDRSGDDTTANEPKLLGDVNPLTEQATKEYEVQVVRSDYLVAADGGRSTVRQRLNIGFPGRTLDLKIFLWDGTYEGDLEIKNVMFLQGVNRKFITAFPLSNGQVRITIEGFTIEPGEDLEQTIKELTSERFEELVNECIAPKKLKIKETSWLTAVKVNERRAEHFVYKNRIFLTGDAAHIHSPAGGQGLNTGLCDAHNLAWKLGLVINGLAPKALLETYAEREPAADRSIAVSSKIFRNRAAGYFSALQGRLFTTLAPLIFGVMKALSLTTDLSMIDIRYNENEINRRHSVQPVPESEFQVGVRARDGTICPIPTVCSEIHNSVDLEPIRLHQILHGVGRFHILVFTSDMLLTSKTSASVSVIQGASTTTAKELEHNINRYLSHWRAKWSYTSKVDDGYEDHKDLFKLHVISGGFGSITELLRGTGDDTGDSSSKSKSFHVLATKSLGDGKLFLDSTKALHRKYGFSWSKGSGGIVVIRPDSHIGYRVVGAANPAWMDVEEYFTSILAPTR
ncbi:hypothetical protein BX616_000380 [Lobosporangium transversale]|uniref:FAD binding domain-domain-containing protein n=1 Tax=Lobosporangium transversale TaxID=64571 RepID=A0A1Y2GQ20_9FUNG|nr:hypothetical protein BCR41DRAFT_421579 [Lobosporangium transversale]KAF9907604.1 hypothetical protein BX616_000380 [Lobosporangium transversale]ORZ18338.1 hypothetical protein BCR41DRAFT_421579 [Lobosporangium transversale]|eukprot:XP_021882133.1 hypothetical protein BCR41DRAFT_421579 [Lobosporangium transversale]